MPPLPHNQGTDHQVNQHGLTNHT